jgi:hypothetical protein
MELSDTTRFSQAWRDAFMSHIVVTILVELYVTCAVKREYVSHILPHSAPYIIIVGSAKKQLEKYHQQCAAGASRSQGQRVA